MVVPDAANRPVLAYRSTPAGTVAGGADDGANARTTAALIFADDNVTVPVPVAAAVPCARVAIPWDTTPDPDVLTASNCSVSAPAVVNCQSENVIPS